MDDVAFLSANAAVESFLVLISSSKRDVSLYPNPAEFVVHFNIPFRNIVGVDLLDVCMTPSELGVPDGLFGVIDGEALTVPSATYDAASLVTAFNQVSKNVALALSAERKMTLVGNSTFYLESVGPLGRQLGFVAGPSSASNEIRALQKPELVRSKYVVIRCPEVEALLNRGRLSDDWCAPGLGLVKFYDFNFDRYPSQKFPHPLGSLGRLTFRIERPDGTLYDSGEHTLLLAIRCLLPAAHQGLPRVLNPAYDVDATRYRASQQLHG